MNSPEGLVKQISDKTTDQLLLVLKNSEDWLPEAVELAKSELHRRGVDTSEVIKKSSVDPFPPLPPGHAVFFPVSPVKLVVMSVVTFGLYEVYWFFMNWGLIRCRTRRKIMPFVRAVLATFFCYSCFKQIQKMAASKGLSCPPPGLIAVSWIFLKLDGVMLPAPYYLIGILSPLMLIPIQKVINNLNNEVAPRHNRNARFSFWNITAIIIFLAAITIFIISKQK